MDVEHVEIAKEDFTIGKKSWSKEARVGDCVYLTNFALNKAIQKGKIKAIEIFLGSYTYICDFPLLSNGKGRFSREKICFSLDEVYWRIEYILEKRKEKTIREINRIKKRNLRIIK
jgi:hypothetical protein